MPRSGGTWVGVAQAGIARLAHWESSESGGMPRVWHKLEVASDAAKQRVQRCDTRYLSRETIEATWFKCSTERLSKHTVLKGVLEGRGLG